MALAPRPLSTAVLVCRSVVFLLQVMAMTYAILAGEFGFSIFILLKLVLTVSLIFHSLRLLLDAGQLFLLQPLPAVRRMMTALVTAEWVMLHAIFAAGSASLGVVDYVDNNMRRCPFLPHGTSSRYRTSGVLTLLAWAFSVPIGIIMILLHAIWDREAAAAQA